MAMRCIVPLAVLASTLATVAAGADVAEPAEIAALATDDACAASEEPEACSLSLRQLRLAREAAESRAFVEEEAIVSEDEAWLPSIFGTTEKCCRCATGTVGWSKSGSCSFCKGKVAKKKSVASDCTVSSKHFKGNTACANLCKTSVGALIEEGIKVEGMGEDGAAADDEAFGEDEAIAESETEDEAIAEGEAAALEEEGQDERSTAGSVEKCCRCQSKAIGYSQSGRCSFCQGRIAARRSVAAACMTSSGIFKGKSACTADCRQAFSDWQWTWGINSAR